MIFNCGSMTFGSLLNYNFPPAVTFAEQCQGPAELAAIATACENGTIYLNSVEATIQVVVLVSPVVVNGNFTWVGENMTIPYNGASDRIPLTVVNGELAFLLLQ